MTESSRIEYKRELNNNLEREVVAFLNAREGGVIWLGIDDTGKVTGLLDCDRIQLKIKDRLKNNIQPSIMGLFDIIHEQRDGKDVIRITLAGGLEKPYYLKKYGMTEKGCFLRIGSATEPMPQEMIDPRALREAVVNAVVHNDYSNGSSPKFEFFKDRLEITSSGGLPYGVELADFFGGYSSPRNKEIMRVFRDLELVEQLGSGVPRILEKYEPNIFEIFPNFLRVIFHYAAPFEPKAQVEAQVEAQVKLTDWQIKLLKTCAHQEKSSQELVSAMGYSSRTGHFKKGLQYLIEQGYLERTRPEKPTSSRQKYRLTEKGYSGIGHSTKGK